MRRRTQRVAKFKVPTERKIVPTGPIKKNYITPLCKIMEQHGSDKGYGGHTYTSFYHKLFHGMRNKALNLFELGIWHGNSLRGWADYFPQANVYGADIMDKLLFTAPRIKTFLCDQNNPASIKALFNQPELQNKTFDIIIDDGCHEYSSYLTFLKHSLHKLKPFGTYIIEDVHINHFPRWQQDKELLSKELAAKIEILDLRHLMAPKEVMANSNINELAGFLANYQLIHQTTNLVVIRKI
ncbi:MAG: hypothetical protein RLZ12_180 [Bacillota bacterium]|jgi:hypothetical protein